MNVADSLHSLTPDITLLAPSTFSIKSTAQALAGSEKETGVLLSILLKPSPAGAVSGERLAESAVALLQKKHAGIDSSAAALTVSGRGWDGRMQLLPVGATKQIVLTTLISADPTNEAQQRNLIAVLEVPQAQFLIQTDFYTQFVAQRLLIGTAQPEPPEDLVFELAAEDSEALPAAPQAPVAERPTLVFTSNFELVPIEAADASVAIDSAALALTTAQAVPEAPPPAPIQTTNFELVPLEVPEPASDATPAATPGAPATATAPSSKSSAVAAPRGGAAATPRATVAARGAPRPASETDAGAQTSGERRAAAKSAESVPAALSEHDKLAMAARGQKVLAYSIALSFVARVFGNVPDVPILLAYAVSAAVLFYAISGVLKICSGFAYTMNQKLVLMFCSSVPLVGILCWIYLSLKITRRLRAAGFEVGLFGVKS